MSSVGSFERGPPQKLKSKEKKANEGFRVLFTPVRVRVRVRVRSQLTEFFLSIRQAYLPIQVTIMAQGRKITAAQKAAAKAAREAGARSAAAASMTEEELTALLKARQDSAFREAESEGCSQGGGARFNA